MITNPVFQNFGDKPRYLLPTEKTYVKSENSSNKITKTAIVTDINGVPLVGANIIDRGDKYNGAATDFDGGFVLTADLETYVKISYLGFTSQTHQFKNMPETIALDGDINNLDEVYLGVVKNKDNTWILLIGLAVAILSYFKK